MGAAVELRPGDQRLVSRGHQERQHQIAAGLARGATDAEHYSLRLRNRRALVITDTELKLMAAAAIIGMSSRPKNG